MKKKLFFFALLSYFSICYPAAQNVVKIEVNPKELLYGECKLNDLVESIEYTPLETNDKCLIGQIANFDITERYIVVYCSKSEKIYLFHRNGRFICQVGSRGGGPGEYLNITGLFIDEIRNRIIIMSRYQRKQLNYDLKGKFTDDKSMDEKTADGLYRRMYNDHFFINTLNYNGNVPFAYEIRDFNLQLITENIKTVYFENPIITMIGSPHNYIYNNKIHTKELSLNDTIYTIENDYSFKPKYIINAGRYEVTKDLRAESDGPTFLKRSQDYVSFREFYETKDKLLIHYHFGNAISYYAYFDNNSRKTLYFKSEYGIPNDYDGGLDFWPKRQDNQYCISFYDAYKIKEHKGNNNQLKPKGSAETISRFEQIYQNLDEEDNPVMVIVKLKK